MSSNDIEKLDTSSRKDGLRNPRAVLLLVLWYIFSGCTLIMNKYVLTYMGVHPILSGQFSCGLFRGNQFKTIRSKNFYRSMLFLGSLRFLTLLTGSLSLSYVAASFTETIKSSAPMFTVFISRFLTGEYTSPLVIASLLPIMSGLALCSATELSFNSVGFVAAIITNISECCQNVFSKLLLNGERYRYTPLEIQIFSSLMSYLVQLPVAFLFLDSITWGQLSSFGALFGILLNGFFFQSQSVIEYALLEYISPVTHSVINTLKRALLIWLSVLFFGNEVTFLSGIGTSIVVLGVFGYNKAKQIVDIRQPSDIKPPSALLSV
ncbi:solute carrier family 35 member E2B-like isoform X2 [Artemia franciscana]|uniref:solute carrier family 35 member E2B-like isoform X2 n=1 Tax=Artemia franciscana TaxID=6661 RepID=UPI0032DA2578